MLTASWPSPHLLLLTVPGAAQIKSRFSIPHSDLYKANWTPQQPPWVTSVTTPAQEPLQGSVVTTHSTEKCAQDLELYLEKVNSPETKSGLYTIQSEFIIIVNVTWHSEGISAVSRWFRKVEKRAQQAQKSPVAGLGREMSFPYANPASAFSSDTEDLEVPVTGF